MEDLRQPSVLITANKTVHIEHLKLMPLADPIIDLCIECGFCDRPAERTTDAQPAPAHRHDARDGAAAPDRRDPARLAAMKRQLRLCRPFHLHRGTVSPPTLPL